METKPKQIVSVRIESADLEIASVRVESAPRLRVTSVRIESAPNKPPHRFALTCRDS
jgi:hypothetical protein